MQHVTSFTMFDSYHVALFTLQTRDFEKIQDGPQCVKWCICCEIIQSYNNKTNFRSKCINIDVVSTLEQSAYCVVKV